VTPTHIRVNTSGSAYEVIVGAGLLREAGTAISGITEGTKIALVSDSTVEHILGNQVAAWLAMGGCDVYGLTVPAGEESKTWGTAGLLIEQFAEYGLGRDDLVVSLGGGVVGDLAGFAAATYLRGIRFVQLPTTLLAQVDASVGGKTGVDLPKGKNLAGAFWQPALVLADTSTLKTLPAREWQSGMAEIAKSAIISGEDFMSWLEANAAELAARDAGVTEEAVVRSVRFKASVVSGDEREAGPRECLNYGHTLGHAIETVAGYGVLPHGLAVADGIRFAARLAISEDVADEEFALRQEALLDALGLKPLDQTYDASRLLSAMHGDKKARAGAMRFVLVSAPGEWECRVVADEALSGALDARADARKRG